MLDKNKQKNDKKKRKTWEGYFPRVVRDKTKYTRKEKHKVISCNSSNDLL